MLDPTPHTFKEFIKSINWVVRLRDCIREEDNFYVKEQPAPSGLALDLPSNPLGCPDRVLDFFKNILPSDIHTYPRPPELPSLKHSLAIHSKREEAEIMLTSGADQAIEIVLTHVLDGKEKMGIMVPTFPRFEIVSRKLCDANVVHFQQLSELPQVCKAVFLCTPNNPTTEELDPEEVDAVVRSNPETFFLIDAVFSDFGVHDMSSLVQYSNVAVLKSLSKSFGLPGLRVGWIESQAENIQAFRKGVTPFRVSLISQRLAVEALKDTEHISRSIDFISKEFQKIQEVFGSRVVRKSHVPFFLFLTHHPTEAREWLLKGGISVVDSTSFPGSREGFLRIVIGKEEENTQLISALKRYMEGE